MSPLPDFGRLYSFFLPLDQLFIVFRIHFPIGPEIKYRILYLSTTGTRPPIVISFRMSQDYHINFPVIKGHMLSQAIQNLGFPDLHL